MSPKVATSSKQNLKFWIIIARSNSCCWGISNLDGLTAIETFVEIYINCKNNLKWNRGNKMGEWDLVILFGCLWKREGGIWRDLEEYDALRNLEGGLEIN